MSANEHDLRRAAGCLEHAAERAAGGFRDALGAGNSKAGDTGVNDMDQSPSPPPLPEGLSVIADASISLREANRFATMLMPVFAVFTFLPYVLVWGITPADITIAQRDGLPMLLLGLLLLPLVLIVSAAVHELLHGIGFILFGKMRWRDVRFGINWRYLTPYAHLDAVLRATPYRWSVLLPGLVLGVVPAVIGLIAGSFLLTFYGFFMLAAAGGDAAVLRAIRHLPGDALLRDHPERAGCLVLGEREKIADSVAVEAVP